jgi:hypothetical protein
MPQLRYGLAEGKYLVCCDTWSEVAFFLFAGGAFARSTLSDGEIAANIVKESREAYYATGHPCARKTWLTMGAAAAAAVRGAVPAAPSSSACWRHSPRSACWSSSSSPWRRRGPQRIKVFKPIDEGDRIDDWLYLPETLYAFMLIIVISAGAGPCSLDALVLSLIDKRAG